MDTAIKNKLFDKENFKNNLRRQTAILFATMGQDDPAEAMKFTNEVIDNIDINKVEDSFFKVWTSVFTEEELVEFATLREKHPVLEKFEVSQYKLQTDFNNEIKPFIDSAALKVLQKLI